MVSTNGTAIATSIIAAKANIYLGWIDKIPGSPPTPIAFAFTLKLTDKRPAMEEPIIPATKG